MCGVVTEFVAQSGGYKVCGDGELEAAIAGKQSAVQPKRQGKPRLYELPALSSGGLKRFQGFPASFSLAFSISSTPPSRAV